MKKENSLSDYLKGDFIGHGAQGIVYTYTERVTGKVHAVKILSNIAIAPKVRPHYDVGFIVVYEVILCLTNTHIAEAKRCGYESEGQGRVTSLTGGMFGSIY